MSREQQVARAFVLLSDSLAAGFDPLAVLERLVGYCVDLVGAAGAGVLVSDGRGGMRTMAVSSDRSALPALLELESRRGPAVDCFRTSLPVHCSELSDLAATSRWPELVPPALEAGYRSLDALPLRLHESTFGAVSLFHSTPGSLDRADLDLTQALADVAALSLVHAPDRPPRREDLLTRLQGAIAGKAALEVAKGMVAEYAGVTVIEAAVLLREYSTRNGVGPVVTAQALTRRSLSPAAITARTASYAPPGGQA
jgi:hypothetical protein